MKDPRIENKSPKIYKNTKAIEFKMPVNNLEKNNIEKNHDAFQLLMNNKRNNLIKNLFKEKN